MDGRQLEITALIPTLGDRPDMLKKSAQSIGDHKIIVLGKQSTWLSKVNHECKYIKGYMLLAGDDSEYHEGAIDKAVECMEKQFPDGDGVVGFNQINLPSGVKWGFILVGEKFLDRFPDRQIFCPDYEHYYADTELGTYAMEVGKFYFCKDAHIDHYHFSVTDDRDNTTIKSTSRHIGDTQTHDKRKGLGYHWGIDFNLIGGNNE